MAAPASAPPVTATGDAPRYSLHIGLFLATCTTTFLAGALGETFDAGAGFAFAGTLMAILVCHEMGHYVVARRHGIDASLPYFIPLPPMLSLGTMGAVIRMRQPITDRNQLIDVGAAGPLAGLAVAIPLLIVGLRLSTVAAIGGALPADPGGAALGAMQAWLGDPPLIEGNSIAYIALKYLVFGQYLPGPGGVDVQLHPIAWASWVGLLITMINLLPIGQLDGGHVACAFLGDRHERASKWLHRILLVVGAIVMSILVADARRSGLTWGAALGHGVWSGMPWMVWALMLLVMRRLTGGVYHPPVSGDPLTPGRRVLVGVMAVVLLLIFTPIPLRQVLP